mmetsp:Transcript_13978/g.58366  ORF Transcript_13978/g.58366 Transcript_13978/m.58366 type:complete len:203 (+) Transcript_13978:468-1076(+)
MVRPNGLPAALLPAPPAPPAADEALPSASSVYANLLLLGAPPLAPPSAPLVVAAPIGSGVTVDGLGGGGAVSGACSNRRSSTLDVSLAAPSLLPPLLDPPDLRPSTRLRVAFALGLGFSAGAAAGTVGPASTTSCAATGAAATSGAGAAIDSSSGSAPSIDTRGEGPLGAAPLVASFSSSWRYMDAARLEYFCGIEPRSALP